MEPTPRDCVNLEEKYSPVHQDVWSLTPKDAKIYAAVSKDMNPIHKSIGLARAFGFPSVIMHGMYLLTRAAQVCAEITAKDQQPELLYPREITCSFTRPVVLPGKAVFRVHR